MNEFKWDGLKLLEGILEGGRKVSELMNATCEYISCDIRKIYECQICIETFPALLINKLECNHRFCSDCLAEYLTVTVKQGGLISNAINCPGFNCKLELEDDFVLNMLEEEKSKEKYLQIIANSFVQVINYEKCHNTR